MVNGKKRKKRMALTVRKEKHKSGRGKMSITNEDTKE